MQHAAYNSGGGSSIHSHTHMQAALIEPLRAGECIWNSKLVVHNFSFEQMHALEDKIAQQLENGFDIAVDITYACRH